MNCDASPYHSMNVISEESFCTIYKKLFKKLFNEFGLQCIRFALNWEHFFVKSRKVFVYFFPRVPGLEYSTRSFYNDEASLLKNFLSFHLQQVFFKW